MRRFQRMLRRSPLDIRLCHAPNGRLFCLMGLCFDGGVSYPLIALRNVAKSPLRAPTVLLCTARLSASNSLQ